MRTFFIGDVQGCFDGLCELLSLVDFSASKDRLLFCGDLVNRGPKSLETLRYILKLNEQGAAHVVLGNHDIHLLAVAHGLAKPKTKDTITDILQAKDMKRLIDWLSQQPLCLSSRDFPDLRGPAGEGFFLSHAGLYPHWPIEQAITLALEPHQALAHIATRKNLLEKLYGNTPEIWADTLSGHTRLRFIINAFTRMRFVDTHGALKMDTKGAPSMKTQAKGCLPWYDLIPQQTTQNTLIFFGHWSALQGHCPHPNIAALDTGYVWGGTMTALALETGMRFTVTA